jgi:hypothetical protein
VPDLGPALAEFARVLRPGGRLMVSDIHLISQYLGGVPAVAGPNGRPGVLPAYQHSASDYVTAALGAGFLVRGCAGPRWPVSDQAGGPLARRWCGPAADAAYTGTAAAVIWHFQRAGAQERAGAPDRPGERAGSAGPAGEDAAARQR